MIFHFLASLVLFSLTFLTQFHAQSQSALSAETTNPNAAKMDQNKYKLKVVPKKVY